MANPVSRHDNEWHNDDGLYILYGVSEADVNRAGSIKYLGNGRHVAEVVISLPDLPLYNATADADVQIVSDTVVIPNGAFIEEVEIVTTKETAGTNANLDLGLVDQDRVTEIDFDGFLVAGDDFNGGTDLGTVYRYVQGTTDHGALIGTKITNSGLITARADTADFTAGVIKVRIFFSVPLSADL